LFRRVLNAIHEGAGEEADLAAIEWRQGCGTWDVGVAMMKPEAYGGGVAAELGVAMGPALDEADEKRAHGRAVKEDEEGPELGGVEPVLEGVEVAFGGAGAGPFAASFAGRLVVGHWGLLCVCLSTDFRRRRMGAASSAPTTGQGRALPYGSIVEGVGERWEGEVARAVNGWETDKRTGLAGGRGPASPPPTSRGTGLPSTWLSLRGG
jgi:hypothetical protein